MCFGLKVPMHPRKVGPLGDNVFRVTNKGQEKLKSKGGAGDSPPSNWLIKTSKQYAHISTVAKGSI